jgi:hypothetical protein
MLTLAVSAGYAEAMVRTVLVERRRDGKLHPPGGRLPEPEHQRAVALAHTLRCRDRMIYRQIVAELEEQGLRVSVGTVHAWLNGGYTCEYCRGEASSA